MASQAHQANAASPANPDVPQPGAAASLHPVPLRLPEVPASPKQGRDLSCSPTPASKRCSSSCSRRGAGKLGSALLPSQSQREGKSMPACPKPEPQPGTTHPSATRAKTEMRRVQGHSPEQSLQPAGCPEQLSWAPRALQKSASLLRNEGRDLFTQLLQSLLPTLQDHELPLLNQSEQDWL